ncbi:MAG: hypothetical protein KBD27_00975 [Candidatus Moranbacteria bacterium]|nr:hypothetical protein [Candidatus Moranbacteria bacterium]
MRYRILFAIVLALLTGCASFKKDAGYYVETTKAEQGDQGGVLPPWRCMSVRGDVSAVFSYTAAMIKLPQPLPEVWRSEVNDPSRSYKVGASVRAVTCSVWRTARYSDGQVEVFDAVMNPDGTELFVLLPPGRVTEYGRSNWLVWFSDGKTVMTTKGVVVGIEGEAFELSNQFFVTHPSPFPQYSNLRRDNPEGRKFFAGLEGRYPIPLPLGNDGEVFSTQPDIVHVGALTKGVNKSDRLVTCGSASAGPSVTLMAVSALLSLPHNISVAKNGCGKKGGVVKEETQVGLLPSDPSQNPERSSP